MFHHLFLHIDFVLRNRQRLIYHNIHRFTTECGLNSARFSIHVQKLLSATETRHCFTDLKRYKLRCLRQFSTLRCSVLDFIVIFLLFFPETLLKKEFCKVILIGVYRFQYTPINITHIQCYFNSIKVKPLKKRLKFFVK